MMIFGDNLARLPGKRLWAVSREARACGKSRRTRGLQSMLSGWSRSWCCSCWWSWSWCWCSCWWNLYWWCLSHIDHIAGTILYVYYVCFTKERRPTSEAIRTRLLEHAMPGSDKLVLSSNVCRHFSLARPKSTHNWHQQAPPRPTSQRTPKQRRQAHAPHNVGSGLITNLTHAVSLVENRIKQCLPEMLKKLAGLSGR